MTTFRQDVSYALRQLRKNPSFTLTVLLTLALGIGANAAIFTLVHSVLLSSLPVVDPATLIRVGDDNQCCVNGGVEDDGHYSLFPTETYNYLRKNIPEFEDLAAMQSGFEFNSITVRRDGGANMAQSIKGEYVSGNYFRTFGLKPAAGRLLTDADDIKGAPMTAVMSYNTWKNTYNGDPSVVGSTFWINTKPVTVIGVAPRGFYGDRLSSTPPEFYLPIATAVPLANAKFVEDPRERWVYIVGRVKPATTAPLAQKNLEQKINVAIRQTFAANDKDFQGPENSKRLPKVHTGLTPGGAGIQAMQENYASHLKLLTWVAGLVLLIACANIANLLLVRGMGRRTEMSVRSALGAQRTRIIRQLLTESVVLSVLGGIAGIAVAYGGAHMLLALAFPGAHNVPIDAAPSLPVIGFAFLLSLITGVLFGVAPAWIAASAQPADALRSNSRTTASGTSLLQRILVVLQAALSLILIVGAALFAQSLSKLENSDLKLDATNRYIIHFNPQAAGYPTTQVEPLYRTIEQNFHAIPGVLKVGISTYTPMEANNWSNGVQIQGKPDIHKGASFVKGNAEYFDSVGTRVLQGRGITTQDTSTSPAVAVVNQSFVKQFFGKENPIGAHFGNPGRYTGDFEIVGVVEDTTYSSVRWKDHSMYFLPMTQRAPSTKQPIEQDLGLYAGAIVIQTDRPMTDMEALARRTLAAINPNLSIVKFQTFTEQIADRFTEERLIARLTMLFGALALLLATIGLYGVTSYGVARRTSEIGIRMALGAERSSLIAMILRGAILQAAVGLAIGVPIAWLCVRFIKSQLYEITTASAGIMLFAIGTLAIAASIAGLIPARRAASIDPVQALRTE
jgi:macrolide transport system ATP-binding/permease protein